MSNEPEKVDSPSENTNLVAFSIVDLMAKRSEKGHVLLNEGDVIDPTNRDDAAIVVLKGRIEVQRDIWTDDGVRQVTLGYGTKGHPLHELMLFNPSAPHEHEADNRYIVREPTTILIIDREQLKKMRQTMDEAQFTNLLGSFIGAQAKTKSELRTRLTETLRENHNLRIALERRAPTSVQQNLQKELDDEVSAHELTRRKLKLVSDKLSRLEAAHTQLREAHAPLVQFLLEIDQKHRDSFAKFSNAFHAWAGAKIPGYTKENADALIKRLIEEGELAFPASLNAALKEEVDSQVMAAAEEPAPLTSRSRDSMMERTAPQDLGAHAKKHASRSSRPPLPREEPPSTVQQGQPRRPSLSALSALSMGAPPTKRASSLPPRAAPEPLPHSAMPPTQAEQPEAKRGGPLLRKIPAVPPRPEPRTAGPASAVPSTSPQQPAAIRKLTPLGMDHVNPVIDPPPRTRPGQGNRDLSIKVPIADLPPNTIVGVEPISPPPGFVYRIPEPFLRAVTPPATKQQRLGAYSEIRKDQEDDQTDDANDVGRETFTMIPLAYQQADEKDADSVREVTKVGLGFKKPQ
ncbi:MAG: hypothetical protein ABIO72_04045 [Patescibacteria group bacterium]